MGKDRQLPIADCRLAKGQRGTVEELQALHGLQGLYGGRSEQDGLQNLDTVSGFAPDRRRALVMGSERGFELSAAGQAQHAF